MSTALLPSPISTDLLPSDLAELPLRVRQEFSFWRSHLEPILSLDRGVQRAIDELAQRTHHSEGTVRKKFYAVKKAGWSALIDRRYVGPDVWNRKGPQNTNLSSADKELVKTYCERYQRSNAAAIKALRREIVTVLGERIARGEQSLVFLNRRGYSPVLACTDCDWKSDCPHCSAFRVFHKIDRTLRCHHCGATDRVPRACPGCGNADIAPLGRGTEQLEEHLAELLGGVRRPDGQPVRIARIDADTTRLKGALESQLAQVHSGEVDVLVGTQMIAKGHDFRRITLVAAINPDSALFSSDFRAPERLFALLMQAAGRAGRDATQGESEMLVQTFHPTHPLFEALKRHDYPAFAASELAERATASLPPFSHQALLRADAREQAVAQGFLNAARQTLEAWLGEEEGGAEVLEQVSLYPAVPMGLQKVADVERAQMLLESPSRKHLHRALSRLQDVLHTLRADPAHKGLIRWLVDVDPQAI